MLMLDEHSESWWADPEAPQGGYRRAPVDEDDAYDHFADQEMLEKEDEA